uniref:NADH-ubiquinone oxidoreductase chain 5 n=1 Tax=Elateroidea sp. BMNH 1274729 TaxID=1796501 RepID=A0A126TGG9_9COLE|nr:NADH dehydrogenase subunit 5 [Elateroidea sp. BMNH 1274729]
MICMIFFFFFFLLSVSLFMLGCYFLILDICLILEFNIFSFNVSEIFMAMIFDWISLVFMSFVLFISSMVIYYSEGYMEGDFNLNRFILLVVLFVGSMMFLIISPNLISILLGWDGLGLVSYCLVIYYQNNKSFNAGMLTALCNRVGDVALLIAIAWMMNFGCWNFVFYFDLMKSDFFMFLISLSVIVAALTKSAQIPFSSWLPAAMAAPTPVSALVHSSTLVTAGVYLLIRFHLLLGQSLSLFLLLVSLMTMFMAGLGANFEFDLKKIIALSTLSQLGVMICILAMGDYLLSFFHLLVHALFKALLFMCSGVMIHCLLNCQDIRFLGSLINQIPLVSCFFNISNMALCGLPFLSGFYSKDLVVEFMSMTYTNMYVYFIFYFSIGLTVSYSLRLSFYSLLGDYNFFSLASFSDSKMLGGMVGLIFLVVIGGSVFSWLIFSTPYFICLAIPLKFMVLLTMMMGAMMGYEISQVRAGALSVSGLKTFFCGSMWFLPLLSTCVVQGPLFLGGLYIKLLDGGWSEYFGGYYIYLKLTDESLLMTHFFKGGLMLFFLLLMIWLIMIWV